MSRPIKFLTVATAAFFLFAGVAYACPGTTFGQDTPVVSKGMPGHDMGENAGCRDTTVNKCQSVRDGMLSGTSLAKQTTVSQGLKERPQTSLAVFVPVPVFSGTSPPPAPMFHPVFKLPFPFSYLVLRL